MKDLNFERAAFGGLEFTGSACQLYRLGFRVERRGAVGIAYEMFRQGCENQRCSYTICP